MRWTDRLQRKFSRFGISNLMIYVVVTMLVAFAMQVLLRLPIMQYLYFDRDLILQGQVWRLITFVFEPPSRDILWIIFALYFYYMIGSALEDVWGASRFTLYYIFGIIGGIIAGFIAGANTNVYLNLSLFFAFAQLFPNHQILLFFFIPIKIKYLAYVNWAIFLIAILWGDWAIRLSAVFSLLNFFLFFGGDFIKRIKTNFHYRKSRRDFRRQMGQSKDIWR